MDQICPKRYHWILHIPIRLGAIFLGAMALLSQSRKSWRSIAPLDHAENSQTKMLWHFRPIKRQLTVYGTLGLKELPKMQKLLESKNKNENQNENKNENSLSFLFSFSFLFLFLLFLIFIFVFIFVFILFSFSFLFLFFSFFSFYF